MVVLGLLLLVLLEKGRQDFARFQIKTPSLPLLIPKGDALMAPCMIQWIRVMAGRFARLFEGRPPELNRSRLVGMYLEQSNRQDRGGPLAGPTKERRDGKFAQKRRRG